MAPKAVLEKKAWEWTAKVAPEEVKQEHILAAYRINLPACKTGSCKRNCRGNPNCLVGIGERHWFEDEPGEPDGGGSSLELERRIQGQCVGLHNLGATCYANALFQLWFHNLEFRSAVYKWNEDEDPTVSAARKQLLEKKAQSEGAVTVAATTEGLNTTVSIEDQEEEQLRQAIAASMADMSSMEDEQPPVLKSACGQLRLLFAKLQFSTRRFVDTADFIKMLDVKPEQQQDVQEFCQLFISHLQDALASQSNATVKHFIQNQFGGRDTCVYRCGTCERTKTHMSSFNALVLPIHHETLPECLLEYLKEEAMKDDNQYFCSRCNCKRDGGTRTELLSLPPVLNMHLMRFNYDRATNRKKKAKTWIQFPEELNMSEYVNGARPDEYIYDLTGVLIHVGPTAYAGHYVAHIRMSETQQWWQFNDENTELMTGKLHLGLYTADISKAKGKKVSKGWHTSNDAYMLVYTRRLPSTDSDLVLSPPEAVIQEVKVDNERLEDYIQNTEKCLAENVKAVLEKRIYMQEVYSLLPARDADTEYYFVDTAWLLNLFDSGRPEGPVTSPDAAALLCPHQLLDFTKVEYYKRISKEVVADLTFMYDINLSINMEYLCKECVVAKCRELHFQKRQVDDSRTLSALLKSKETWSSGYWVGKVSFQRWRRLAVVEFARQYPTLSSPAQVSSEPSCSPGPGKANVQNATTMGDDEAEEGRPTGTASEDNSVEAIPEDMQCTESLKTSPDPSPAHPTNCSAANGDQDEPCTNDSNGTLVSDGDDLKDEKDADGLSSGDQMVFNEECVCEHGGFSTNESARRLVAPEAWKILSSYFPHSKAYPADEVACSLCVDSQRKSQSAAEALCITADLQRDVYASLLSSRNQALELQENETESLFYVVSGDFLDRLKRFVKGSGLVFPPSNVDNSTFFCQHNALLYSFLPDAENDMCPKFSFVTDEHWQAICNNYECEHSIIACVNRADDKSLKYHISPDVCTVCYDARLAEEQKEKLRFDDATVYVRLVDENPNEHCEAPTTTDNRTDQDKAAPPPAKRVCFQTENGSNVRRSGRQRRTRDSMVVRVSSTESLLDMKLKLMKQIRAAPFDQHLALDAGGGVYTELGPGAESLADYGIVPNCTLVMWIDKPVDKEDMDVVHVPDNVPLEEGFKGTKLLSS